MIDSVEKAARVQSRRRVAGLKGRSKAVRRWFKREYGRAIEAHGGRIPVVIQVGSAPSPTKRTLAEVDLHDVLRADFSGCRRFDEVHK